MRNDVKLCYYNAGHPIVSHFNLREFETGDGFVMVDASVLVSLERVRADLGVQYGCEVRIYITCCVRTNAENEALGERLGWTHEDGIVARDSRHLPKYGGIAVDIYAVIRSSTGTNKVPQAAVAKACREHFEYVKADYYDGHVHADNREI